MQPPGDSIPVNVMQSITDDSPSTEQTTKGAVMKSQNSFTGGTTKMGAKDLKQWLNGIKREEKAKKDGGEG